MFIILGFYVGTSLVWLSDYLLSKYKRNVYFALENILLPTLQASKCPPSLFLSTRQLSRAGREANSESINVLFPAAK